MQSGVPKVQTDVSPRIIEEGVAMEEVDNQTDRQIENEKTPTDADFEFRTLSSENTSKDAL